MFDIAAGKASVPFMSKNKYSNTISSCAYSLGISEDFLAESLERLREASDEHKQLRKQGVDTAIKVIVSSSAKEEAK